ncbi:MAG TPA: NrfD/PsrC family molybdoenzyme membrane anchor subunit [Myxococcales bacterium]|nr:NrfD/PsrC family molybdoenzyme membrane anchor subunit [Myxococcales bacterium]
MSARRIPDVEAAVLRSFAPPGWAHWLLIALSGAAAAVGGWCWSEQIRRGMIVTGLSNTNGWGVYITNFVFWVGIAHSGTLISAILLLFRARFRTAVYRAAEAMTVIAVTTAGLFPILHLGRPWFCYWLFPYPNQRGLWVNFKSPLVWDVFAVSTYFTVSAVFLFVGMIPDVAALKARVSGWRRALYRALSLGWRNGDGEWRAFSRGYLFFAALATPLVVSVHSVVSWDFAMAILPGWHSTLFAPYFVAGAIFSGVAMVITLLIPLRKALGIEDLITPHHLDMLARLVLLTSLIVAYSYATEYFTVAFGGSAVERSTFAYRALGSYAPLFWVMVFCNCVNPLLLFVGRIRRSAAGLLWVCVPVNIGMWLERFVIIATSLSHNQDPFTWRTYHPSLYEVGITLGSFGWFFFWFLIFVKVLPSVSVAEIKEGAHTEAEGVATAAEVAHAA